MQPIRTRHGLGAAALGLAIALMTDGAASAAPTVPGPVSSQMLEVLERSIAFRTFPGQDQVSAYAAYLAEVLQGGGFAAGDITIAPFEDTATLVARYRGANPDAKPVVIVGHMDVVPALRKDWQRDPFTAVVEQGFVFGRGSSDNKFGIASMVTTLLWLKSEGFEPSRDIVLALTGDEETSQASTAVLAQQLRNAELVLNSDAGGATLGDDGKPIFYGMQAAEKTYVDFEISFASPGGHSSRPGPDNAIYRLAKAVDRIAAYRFPTQANELTRAYFRAAGALTPGEVGAAMRRYAENPADAQAVEQLASMPEHVGQLGTTCVATMLEAGHARNALPQNAMANVNCRMFPGVSIESVQESLERVVDDSTARFAVIGKPVPSDASPLREDVMTALRKAIDLRAPGLPIVPAMSAGATDSLYFRNVGVPSYGVSGLFMHPKDNYAHGLDERVPLDSIDGALLQWRSLLTDLAR
jgi:acetylornithine deacetylase/succinyl-diaminopimelate desuccinylase-like protein